VQWAAAERTGDADASPSLLADDFVLVGPLGFMLDKQQYLGSRRSGDLKHESFAWADVRVRIYGESAVAVGTQTQRSTYQGGDASGRFRVTQIATRQIEAGKALIAACRGRIVWSEHGVGGRLLERRPETPLSLKNVRHTAARCLLKRASV